MNPRELENEFDKDAPLREPLDQLSTTPPAPPGHRDFILSAARSEAARGRTIARSIWTWV